MISKIVVLALVVGVALSASLPDYNKKCVPGSQFKIECNYCICLDNGTPACTRQLCEERPKARSMSLVEADMCVPGETYKDGCNFCTCLVGGIPDCTKMICRS
ncbi:protease inhibitors isoform X2 [Fopius arisanus]|nr:PREDICTED: protease inhibitors-like isoform X2 [Fopius arisanus]XP_011305492.1 PREDICTED: protease inhibitors-like isoform X2 [Fopius arisanus]